jgi:hypothetical protein
VALFVGGGGLSVEFGSDVGLRRWLFFRTVELLKGKTINYIFFFNKIRCFHVYFI